MNTIQKQWLTFLEFCVETDCSPEEVFHMKSIYMSGAAAVIDILYKSNNISTMKNIYKELLSYKEQQEQWIKERADECIN